MIKKIIILSCLFFLISCSSNNASSNISSLDSSESTSELPSTNANDVGGDHLQSDWEWDK